MSKRVFIIDDERSIITIAATHLEGDHFRTTSETNPVLAIKQIRDNPPDLVLLDVSMPKMSGLDVCRALKSDPKTAHIPIIFFSVKADEADVVLGLESGADDYIRKPIRGPEFLARVRAALRRQESPMAVQELKNGPFRIDYASYRVWIDDEPIKMTSKQLELLALFLRNESRVLTRGVISNAIWGTDLTGSSRAIDTMVDRLRRKIGRYRTCIESMHGLGYRFEIPPQKN